MAVFAFSIIPTERALEYLEATQRRLQNGNLLKNPFSGGLFYAGEGSNSRHIFGVVMDPVYPKVWLMGFIWLAGAIIFQGSWGWYLPGLILASMGFFWSSAFMYIGLVLGAKKAGYKEKVKLVEKAYVLRLLQRQNNISNDKNFLALLKSFKQGGQEINKPGV